MLSIAYLLLSRTYGMHLYTADLAQAVLEAGGDVHLVTVAGYPAHVYDPRVQVHAIWPGEGRTMSAGPLLQGGVERVVRQVRQISSDIAHFTGPQLLAPLIARRLRASGIPVVYSLHDLDPHPGAVYGRALHLWNRGVIAHADRILVHATVYRDRLLATGPGPERVVRLPLLHLFVGSAYVPDLSGADSGGTFGPCALFFGRVTRYKGVDVLLRAWDGLTTRPTDWQLIIAGQGDRDAEPGGPLPVGVERRNRLVDDAEAIALFQRCSVLVLPYTGATQSALIPAAYYFGKPVIATRSGALPEYVAEGETGWLVPEDDPDALRQALAEALGDPEGSRRMGRAGRAWYDEQRIGERKGVLALYEEMRT